MGVEPDGSKRLRELTRAEEESGRTEPTRTGSDGLLGKVASLSSEESGWVREAPMVEAEQQLGFQDKEAPSFIRQGLEIERSQVRVSESQA